MPTQQQRRSTTEHRLVEAAIDLIAVGGSRRVTLAAVGAAAGYSRGIVSHHFGSRHALMSVVARTVQRRFLPPVSAESGLERVLAIVDSYLLGLVERERDARAFLVLWTEGLASDPELRSMFAERDADFRATVAGAVAAAISDGSLRSDADPEDLSVGLVGVLRGVGLQRMHSPYAVDMDGVRRELRVLLCQGLAAVRPPTDGHQRGHQLGH